MVLCNEWGVLVARIFLALSSLCHWPFPGCGGGLWALSKFESSEPVHASPSEVYPTDKLQ